MFAKLLYLTFALAAVKASGDFTVLHCPDSINFHGEEPVSQSLLKEIFTAALGYTVKLRGTWSGMSITDPFHLPEAVVGIAVEGVNSLESPRGKRYPLNVDEGEETTWQILSGRLEKRDNMNIEVRLSLEDGVNALGHSILGELKPSAEQHLPKSLNPKNEADRKLLEEIQLLDAITKKVPSAITADDKPDVYWFVLSALGPVIDLHGADSAAAKEAYTLMNDALARLSNAFMDVYSGKVLICAFTNDGTHVRQTRDVGAENRADAETPADTVTGQSLRNTVDETTEANLNQNSTDSSDKKPRVLKSDQINISKVYDDTYPVMFNIFLWFGVAFVFSLIAICITIADMDPGRDSVIYRMTSNRMKKDN